MLKEGNTWEDIGLDGSETFTIGGMEDLAPRKTLQIKAVKPDGKEILFDVIARLDTEIDIEYFKNGGILQYVIRKILNGS